MDPDLRICTTDLWILFFSVSGLQDANKKFFLLITF
jgi:hypothetical protein